MLAPLDTLLHSLAFPWSLIVLCLVMAVVAVLAWKAKQLTVSGAVLAWAEGVCISWFLGFEGLAVMLLFFLSAAVIGRCSKRIHASGDVMGIQKKTGARDWMQVIANGAPATAAALLYGVAPTPLALVMFGAGVAEAASDTWAGEIGVLSRRKPVSILTMRPVSPGLSGGISVLGTFSGLAGALMIAVFWLGCFAVFGAQEFSAWIGYASFVTVGGFSGCLMDSLLGALVQAHYWDDERQRLTEHEFVDGRKLELSRGIRWVDNDMVNLISNLFGVLLAGGLSMVV